MAESANRTKKGGQELVGGLDVRVNRNFFGRQTESFEAKLDLQFLNEEIGNNDGPFQGVFIRAPVVESIMEPVAGVQQTETVKDDIIIAPGREPGRKPSRPVEVMGRLPGRSQALKDKVVGLSLNDEIGDIIAVRQHNCFATSFHPELTEDARIHKWWLMQVEAMIDESRRAGGLRS